MANGDAPALIHTESGTGNVPLSLAAAAPIKVIICDRHRFYRDWVRNELSNEPDITVIADADDVVKAIENTPRDDIDVVLLEAQSASAGPAERATVVRRLLPDAKVLVIASNAEELPLSRVLALRDAGANGCLLSDVAPGELAAAIRIVCRDSWVVPQALAQPLFSDVLGLVDDSAIESRTCPRCGYVWEPSPRLTARELDVLRLVAEGQTNRTISVRLGLSEGTIKNYVQRIFKKLGISSRVEAAVYAAREGLL